MKTATIQLEALACPSCVQKIEGAIKSFDSVEKDSIKIMFNSSRVRFNFDDEKLALEDVEKTITGLGYEIKKSQVK